MTFEDTKLLAASTSAVEWYKSCAHISFLSEVIQIFIHVRMYVPTQREQGTRTCIIYNLCSDENICSCKRNGYEDVHVHVL